MTQDRKNRAKIVNFEDAQKAKALDLKEEKMAEMAKRFDLALPSKATPVKDYLKKKRKNKKKK